MLTKDKIVEIPTDQLVLSDWDIRRYPDSAEELDALEQSIRKDGLINPLTVTPTRNGDYYQVIAGRRRLHICRKIGIHKLPCYIKYDSKYTEQDTKRITLIENLHRRELRDAEKAYGILAVYEAAGYNPQQAITGVKTLDNMIKNRKRAKKEIKKETENYLPFFKGLKLNANVRQDNPVRDGGKFIEVVESIGYSPAYQYQLLQYAVQVQQDIIDEAEKEGLKADKKTMLTNSRLRAHPKLQRALIHKIKDVSEDKARDIIHQTLHNLETGYVKKDDETDTYTVDDIDAKEDIKKEQRNIEKQTSDVYFDITSNTKRLLYSLTGRSISKGQYRYTDEIIKNTHNYRLQVVKSLDTDTMQLNTLYLDYLKLAKIAIEDMMKLIEQELEFAKEKKEMLRE